MNIKTVYILLLQIVASALTVDEGGEARLDPRILLLSDVDSMEEALQVKLKKTPQHGALQLGGSIVKPGQAFTVHDLRSYNVRSDTLVLYGLLHGLIKAILSHTKYGNNLCKNVTTISSMCHVLCRVQLQT